MEAKAIARFIRCSPRKARLVADQVRGRDFQEAADILKYMPNKGAELILKVVNSARANAGVINDAVRDEDLFVKKIFVDEGPIMRRFMPRARGRATRIRKRTAHITVVLGTEE